MATHFWALLLSKTYSLGYATPVSFEGTVFNLDVRDWPSVPRSYSHWLVPWNETSGKPRTGSSSVLTLQTSYESTGLSWCCPSSGIVDADDIDETRTSIKWYLQAIVSLFRVIVSVCHMEPMPNVYRACWLSKEQRTICPAPLIVTKVRGPADLVTPATSPSTFHSLRGCALNSSRPAHSRLRVMRSLATCSHIRSSHSQRARRRNRRNSGLHTQLQPQSFAPT